MWLFFLAVAVCLHRGGSVWPPGRCFSRPRVTAALKAGRPRRAAPTKGTACQNPRPHPVPSAWADYGRPSSFLGCRKGGWGILIIPIGYTKVYNPRWSKPANGAQKRSKSIQIRSKVIKNDKFPIAYLNILTQNGPGASAKGVLTPSNRAQPPVLAVSSIL
jgi:hypothetical protein